MLLVLTLRGGVGSGRNSLTPTQATLLINRENAQIIDVREPRRGTRPGICPSRATSRRRSSKSVPANSTNSKDTPLVLVCQTGARVRVRPARTSAKLGFAKVNSLGGGLNAWREAGLPLKKGTKKCENDAVPRVLMYSTAGLPVLHPGPNSCCARAGVSEIEKVRVDLEPARRAEMMQKTARRTVPQIFIGATHVGGLRRSRRARSGRKAPAPVCRGKPPRPSCGNRAALPKIIPSSLNPPRESS